MDARKLIGILLVFFGLLVNPFGQKAIAVPQIATFDGEDIALNLLSDKDRTALTQGQQVEVIVEFDQTEAVNLAATRRAQKAIQYDDDEILAERAQNYKWQKNKTLAVLAAPLTVLHDYDQLPMLFARVRSSDLKDLLRAPGVKAVHSNTEMQLSLAQSLPIIQQPTTAAIGGKGAGVAVAVIDSGVDYTRAAFGNCTAPGVPEETCRVVAAADIAPNDDARDNNGHGTNVAGIVLGVAPEANIVALDVVNNSGTIIPDDGIKAINWVLSHRTNFSIVAVNLSFGLGKFTTTCPNDIFATPIKNARIAGILTAASSGNNGWKNSLGRPACVPEAVSVGAVYDANVGSHTLSGCTDPTTRADQITCFSNSASFLTLLAPGALITAAGITMSGTSQATPHVAGAIAVLRAAYPGESLDATVARLTSTGVPITDTNNITKPRINLLRAYRSDLLALPAILQLLLDDDAPVSYRLTVNFSTNGGAAGTVTSTPSGINACSTSCSANFNSGARVTLTARPTSGTFGGWTGAGCSGTGNCVVTMTAAQSVIATFNGGSGEVFPPNGAWPSGWTTPATSNANWIVANSPAAHEGSYTLRSGVIGHDQKSQVQVSRTFQAGTVRFARKVSSENGYDFLRFYVDGVKKGEWSGVQDWVVVSYPLTAGAHTLLWSYEKDDSAVAGNDVARIDSVSLPPAGGTTYALTVSKAGTGTGTVTSAPAGINCGSACSANFNSGVRVTLTPAAASGSTFAGWTGACTNATGNCVVTMTAAQRVTATFNRVTSSCLSSMAAGTTVSGSWAAGCNATHRPGSYAKYYTFTLGTPQTVVINLTSATADSYLFLLSGNGMNGAAIAEDDDSGGSSNARITKALAAGTYTVEATTFYAATTGSFSLSVQASGGVNLVTNGGFENLGTGITMPPVGWYTYYAGNTFPGWQVNSGNVNIQTSAHGGVHSGSYALDLAGDAAGSISQTLPTVAGRQYTLELWYAASPYHPYSGPAQARVRWGGADIIGGLLSRDPTTATTNLMTRVQYVVTASSSTTTLSLVGLSPNGGIIVDDVSLIAR